MNSFETSFNETNFCFIKAGFKRIHISKLAIVCNVVCGYTKQFTSNCSFTSINFLQVIYTIIIVAIIICILLSSVHVVLCFVYVCIPNNYGINIPI